MGCYLWGRTESDTTEVTQQQQQQQREMLTRAQVKMKEQQAVTQSRLKRSRSLKKVNTWAITKAGIIVILARTSTFYFLCDYGHTV